MWTQIRCRRKPHGLHYLSSSILLVNKCHYSAPASPIWSGVPPLLPSPAAPLPFLSCPLSFFNSRHKTLHFGENFRKIRPKLKKMLSMFKCQFHVYSIFEGFFCGMGLYFVLCLDTRCPDSCMIAQKVPYPAPLCPQILAGALSLDLSPVKILEKKSEQL